MLEKIKLVANGKITSLILLVIVVLAFYLKSLILISILPILLLFTLLIYFKFPAWKASAISSVFVLLVSIFYFQAFNSINAWLIGALFGIWNVSWLIFWTIFFFNVFKLTGLLEEFKNFILKNSVNDIRVLSLILAFSFGAIIEGITGFGTPWAYVVPILVSFGIPELKAITISAIANTAPVSFGAFGLPMITLASVTDLPLMILSHAEATITFIEAFLVTFLILYIVDGIRGIKEAWHFALIASLSYGIVQYLVATYLGPYLPDVLGSISSLIALFLASRFLKAKRIQVELKSKKSLIALFVFISFLAFWTFPFLPFINFSLIKFSYSLENSFAEKSFTVSYSFNPFSIGTGAFLAFLISLAVIKPKIEILKQALKNTLKQTYGAILTSLFVFSLAYTFNFIGFSYFIAYYASQLGFLFFIISPLLGTLGAALTGSNTSSNAIFGNIQYLTGIKLGFPEALLPIANSTGAELGKPIAPQTVSVGVTTSSYVGKEGEIIKNNFKYVMFLVACLIVILFVLSKIYPYPFIVK
ncbi:MAG: L-lactate permease [Candidatus Aenigmatarchaeota archaeon]